MHRCRGFFGSERVGVSYFALSKPLLPEKIAHFFKNLPEKWIFPEMRDGRGFSPCVHAALLLRVMRLRVWQEYTLISSKISRNDQNSEMLSFNLFPVFGFFFFSISCSSAEVIFPNDCPTCFLVWHRSQRVAILCQGSWRSSNILARCIKGLEVSSSSVDGKGIYDKDVVWKLKVCIIQHS